MTGGHRSGRLRVAMVAACPFPWPRGTPVRVHRMAEALSRRGHDVHVVTYHLGKPLSAPGFAVHRIRDVPGYVRTAPGPSARKLFHLDLLLTGLLTRLHAERPFDVIHAHHYEGILVASRVRRAPLVYDAHTLLAGELPYYPLGIPRSLKRRIGGVVDRWLPRRAAYTVAVSESIRHRLVEIGAVAEDRVCVIANGVEFERFRDNGEPRAHGETLIFAGTLAPYQGVDLMLESLATLRARRPGVRLRIVTDSPFDPFEALARRLGVRDAVEVCSATFDQQPALLASADVALSPRVDCDGIPQKLLNYMAAGKPIVSFDGSAVHLEHERTALRVPDGDTGAMARAIERLLDDRELARRLGETSRRDARRKFSWEGVATRVEEVYRRVLGSRTAARDATRTDS